MYLFTYQYKSTKRGGGVIFARITYYNDDVKVVCGGVKNERLSCYQDVVCVCVTCWLTSFEVKGFHATEEGLRVINTRRPRAAVHTKGVLLLLLPCV